MTSQCPASSLVGGIYDKLHTELQLGTRKQEEEVLLKIND